MAPNPSGASQRLLTMKFMQRAAAANSSPTLPSTSVSASDDARPSKRRKLGGQTSLGAPEATNFLVDQKAAQAALEDEDRKRQAAMDRMAERLGDSHWVLDTAKLPLSHKQEGTPLKIMQVGFSEIDKRGVSEEGQEEEDEAQVFQSYGPQKKTQKYKDEQESNSHSETGSETDSDSDSSELDTSSEAADEASHSKPGRASYGSQKRDEIRFRKKAAQEKSRKMASERRTKHVKLHKLRSISGAAFLGAKGSRPDERRR